MAVTVDQRARTRATGKHAGLGLGLVLIAVLALSACSSASSAPEASRTMATEPPAPTVPTTAAAPPPTTTVPSPEEEVAAKYREFWNALLVTANPPDPSSALLTQTMTGAMLEHVRADTQNLLETGMAVRLPASPQYGVHDLVVTVDGSTAQIAGCVIDDLVIHTQVGGRVLNDRVTSARVEATAELTIEGWRISYNRSVTKVEGTSECA